MNRMKIADLLRQMASIIEADDAETAPVQEQKAKPVAIEDVRAVLTKLSRQGRTAEVHDLIVRFGAEKLSAVDPEKYADLLAVAQEMSNAG